MKCNNVECNSSFFLFIVSEHCCICTKAISYPFFVFSTQRAQGSTSECIETINRFFFRCIIFAHNEERSTNFNDDSDERATAIFILFLCSAFLYSFQKNSNYDAKQGYLFQVQRVTQRKQRECIQSLMPGWVSSHWVWYCAFWCAHSELHYRTQFTHNLLSFRAQAAALCSTGTLENVNSWFQLQQSTCLTTFPFHIPSTFRLHLALSSGYMRPPPLICHFHTANLGIGLKIVT